MENGFPRFSELEFNSRYEATKKMMDEIGVDVLLFFALGGNNRNNMANIYYLTGYRDFNHAYLIFPKEGDPSLFVGLYNHLHNAQNQAVIKDVRHGGYGNPVNMADQLDKIGAGNQTIGFIGVNPRFGINLPYDHTVYLEERFPEAKWKNASTEFRNIRLVKSKEELEWLQEGCRLTDLSMKAVQEYARPGITEAELSARMGIEYKIEGGEQLVHFVTATPMNDPHTPLPWQNPTSRKLEVGDVLLTEISAAFHGYAGQILRPFTIGVEPTKAYSTLFDASIEVYEAVANVMKDGAGIDEIMDATDILPDKGYQIYDSLAHGFGVDLLQPSVGIRGSNYAKPPKDFIYKENMTMVIQPNPMDEEGHGLQTGDFGVVTKGGFKSMHQFPQEFFRCG